MTNTELRVKYRNGDPREIRFGRGYMGEPSSLANMKSGESGVAIIMYDNSGSTDFEKALKELPFVDSIINPDND